MLTQLSCVHKLPRFSIIHKDNLFTQNFPIHFYAMSADWVVISWLMPAEWEFNYQTKGKGAVILYPFTFGATKEDEKDSTHLFS